ncbi:MAG: bifunctional adenosylcobinamide kinase/adenosylcobinamide-phosphate guanylyltransferase, partial [Mariprofundales bacterium]|nr:bifunctional adenosylcobinamide kinase/adenosylcobinamide-phosphate guanylyltransferase [Mariprofundales bacterium]
MAGYLRYRAICSTRQLILGAASSGKSRFAEQQAAQYNLPVIYIATARQLDGDDEWQRRIAEHRQRRDAGWQTVEAPYSLPEAVKHHADSGALLLVD